MATGAAATQHTEPHDAAAAGALNRLRAGVLGANDGIVSTAGLVTGVAGATTDRQAILVAGVAGLVAGALSMAGGEYVSVSAQRDTERAMLAQEREELATRPAEELEELTGIYRGKGLHPGTARRVARELTAYDALAAHASAELGIDPGALSNAGQAAWVSMLAFATGACLPLGVMLLVGPSWRVAACFVAVAVALAATGSVSARLGGARRGPAVLRNVGVGALAMAVTYGVGVGVGALT